MRHPKKHLDFELNLVPFIDLLSVCICFLLLTAVWLNLGSMNVKQAVGGQAAAETEKKPVIWTFLDVGGDLTLDVRDSRLPKALSKLSIKAVNGQADLEALAGAIDEIKAKEPELRTVLIQPKGASVYEDIIKLMDQFKKSGLSDLGVVPL